MIESATMTPTTKNAGVRDDMSTPARGVFANKKIESRTIGKAASAADATKKMGSQATVVACVDVDPSASAAATSERRKA